jgi:predicted ester cyclase
MSTEENKALVRRFVEEVVNQHNVDVLDQITALDFRTTFPVPEPGRAGFKQAMAALFAGFPDVHSTTEDVIAEGDRVATRGRWTGTQQGEFQGIPPTSTQVQVSYIDVWRVQNGQLVENWVQMDFLGLLQQLGVVPAPGQAGA